MYALQINHLNIKINDMLFTSYTVSY